jgi:hypothetical protein
MAQSLVLIDAQRQSEPGTVRKSCCLGWRPLGFEPYLPLAVIGRTNDTHDGTGNVALLIGAGLRYQFSDRIKAGIQVSEELRSGADSTIGSANLRIAF